MAAILLMTHDTSHKKQLEVKILSDRFQQSYSIRRVSIASSSKIQIPDLNKYDLEYAELLGVDWKKEICEIELKIRCPVVGWAFKEKLIKVLEAGGMEALLGEKCTEYFLMLTFLGVSEVTETLISHGHTIGGYSPSDRSWLRSFIFEIGDIRVVKLDNGTFRFYLRAEGMTLDFNFTDCIFRQKCIEK